jgi:hypothetical protein
MSVLRTYGDKSSEIFAVSHTCFSSHSSHAAHHSQIWSHSVNFMIDDGPYLFEPICHDDHLHLFYKVCVIISAKNGRIMLIRGEINKAITSDLTGRSIIQSSSSRIHPLLRTRVPTRFPHKDLGKYQLALNFFRPRSLHGCIIIARHWNDFSSEFLLAAIWN